MRVADAVQARLLAMAPADAAAELWRLDVQLLRDVCAADFPVCRAYVGHLLARLLCILWRHVLADADAAAAEAAATMAAAASDAKAGAAVAEAQAASAAQALRAQYESGCVETRKLAGELDAGQSIDEAAKDCTERLLSLVSYCGYVRKAWTFTAPAGHALFCFAPWSMLTLPSASSPSRPRPHAVTSGS